MRTRSIGEAICFCGFAIALICLMAWIPNPAQAAENATIGKIIPDPSRLWSPGRTAVDAEGILYVVDAYKNRVQKFDSQGTFKGSIRVSRPSAVAAAPDGGIYIGSHGEYAVSIYKRGEITGYLGAGRNEFASINDIVVDKSTSDVYVVDTKSNAVRIYSDSGALKGKLGGFTAPIAAAVTDSEILVLDAPIVPCSTTIMIRGTAVSCADCTGQCSGSRITALDKTGAPVRNLTESGVQTDTMARPVALAVDAQGNVYVADALRNVIIVYDRLFGYIGELAGSRNDLHEPLSLTLSRDNSLYVSSSETQSIMEVGLAGMLHTAPTGSLHFQTKSGAGVSLGVLGY